MSNEKAYETLCILLKKQQNEDTSHDESMESLKIFNKPNQITSLDKEHLNGIGRIVQYTGHGESK